MTEGVATESGRAGAAAPAQPIRCRKCRAVLGETVYLPAPWPPVALRLGRDTLATKECPALAVQMTALVCGWCGSFMVWRPPKDCRPNCT
jgi:hypothetical protein